MKPIRFINLLLVAVFLASCGGNGGASKTGEPGLPTPQIHTTETPDVTAILTWRR